MLSAGTRNRSYNAVLFAYECRSIEGEADFQVLDKSSNIDSSGVFPIKFPCSIFMVAGGDNVCGGALFICGFLFLLPYARVQNSK